MSFHRRVTYTFSATMIALGVLLLAETVRAGGGSVGYLAGILFAAVGVGRIYLMRRG